jgi:quercetin dioxygenase-like cupin family protein
MMRLRKGTLAPGAVSLEHTHRDPNIQYVLEGTLTLRKGTTESKTEAGKINVEHQELNVPHTVRNDGTGTMRFLLVDLYPEPAPLAAAPTLQGVTIDSLGRGAGSITAPLNIEAGKTDLRVARNTLAPGGYIGWHYHNGPSLVVVEKGTLTLKQADGTAVDYPAGSAFFEPKALVHRADNKGTVDAVVLATQSIAGGPPAETPTTVFVPDPTTTTPTAGQPNEQGVTREAIGRGAGSLKEPLQIAAGKTDLRVVRFTFAPGGYVSWHYHNGPPLAFVEKGTITSTTPDGAAVNYPAGSAFFESKGWVHRADNKGNVDAVLLVTFPIAGGPPAETPTTVFVPDPTIK